MLHYTMSRFRNTACVCCFFKGAPNVFIAVFFLCGHFFRLCFQCMYKCTMHTITLPFLYCVYGYLSSKQDNFIKLYSNIVCPPTPLSQVQAYPSAGLPLSGLPQWSVHQHHPLPPQQPQILWGEGVLCYYDSIVAQGD